MVSLTRVRIAVLVLSFGTHSAFAIEAGVDTYGLGAEGVLAGGLPPPGLYGIVYQNHYEASRLADDAGHSAIPGFGLHADSVTPRLIWMTHASLAGGEVGYYALMPIVNLRVSVPGRDDSRTGNGDLSIAPLLAYHSAMFHWGYALEFVLPVGAYDQSRLANLGRNYLTVRPIFGWSYHDPLGWDVSTKMSLSLNSRNSATDYRSGSYMAGDYTLGYRVFPRVLLGLEGYFLEQLGDDTQQGHAVNDHGNRARVIGIGAGMQYQAPSGYSLEGKFVRDTNVRNRSDGTSVWIRLAWKI